MAFSINFLTNVLVIALGLLALITGISIFPTTKKYKTAAITFSHSKKEWTWISLLERAIAIFYFVIFSVVLISVVLIAVYYDIATFWTQAANWERTDIWYYPLFSMFVPFAAIMVCSAVALPLISKAKKATLCSSKNIELLKNTKSGLSEKSAYAVCNYSIFVCAFNILAAAAVIVLTFLKFITSTAIFASNEYIQVSIAGIIILSLIFMFALAIVMSANSRKSKYEILNFNTFMKAEYMNKDQVVRTKGWNAIFVFAQLFGLIALGGFIAISLVWFISFNWSDLGIPQIIGLKEFEKQILIYVSYGLAGFAALSLFFSLITIASLKHNFYNTRALFTQNLILSLLGVVASAAYIVIDLGYPTIFNPLPTAMSIGQILIIIALFTLIPGFIAFLVLAGYFINKQNEKPYLLYSYIQTLNKNKKEEIVPTVQNQPVVASTTYVQQPQSNADHECAKQISEFHKEIAELNKTIESSDTKPTITTDQSQPVVASTTYVQQPQPVYNNTPPIYINVANTQQPQSNGDHESAKQISELHEEIAELKKTIESSDTKPTITTDQSQPVVASTTYVQQPQPVYNNTPPIYINVANTQQPQSNGDYESAKQISELHEEIAELKRTIESSNTKPTITTDQSQPAVASTTYVQLPQSNGDHESAKQISEFHEEIAELKKTIESSNTKPTFTTDQIEDIPAYIDINRVANEKSSTTYPIWKNKKGSSQVKKPVKQEEPEEPKETKTTLYPIWKNKKGLNPRFKKKSSPKKKSSKKRNRMKAKIVFKERGFFQRKPKKDSKKKK